MKSNEGPRQAQTEHDWPVPLGAAEYNAVQAPPADFGRSHCS